MSHVRCSAVVCGVLCVVGVVITSHVVADDLDLAESRRVAREAESKLLAGLNNKIKAEWSDASLDEVLASLAKSTGVSLWIDHEGLSNDGVSTDATVDLHLGEVTAWQALHFLLKNRQLNWHGSDGLLAITTQDRANQIQLTRTYDVQKIVSVLEPVLKTMPHHRSSVGGGNLVGFGGGGGFFRVPEIDETVPIYILPQFGGGGGGSIGSARTGIAISTSRMRGEEFLSELLMQVVAARWEVRDGEGGTINLGEGRLIVRQGYHVHFQIQSLLNIVEEFVVLGSKAKSVVAARPDYPHATDAEIFKKLAQPQLINARDVPLSEPLEMLASRSGIRLWIDRESLEEEGISLDSPVTLRLNGSLLDTILHKLLEPFQLTFVVEEGTLVITTRARAEEAMTTRVCFTGDIPESRISLCLPTAIQEASSGHWDEVDGEGGTMFTFAPDWLVIRQTQVCHREISELLDDLRKPATEPSDAAAPTEPNLELKLYPVADKTAIMDLIKSLPTLVPNWDKDRGSAVQLGQSLAIKQPPFVHDQLEDIFSALNQAHARLNPPKPKEEPKPAPATK